MARTKLIKNREKIKKARKKQERHTLGKETYEEIEGAEVPMKPMKKAKKVKGVEPMEPMERAEPLEWKARSGDKYTRRENSPSLRGSGHWSQSDQFPMRQGGWPETATKPSEDKQKKKKARKKKAEKPTSEFLEKYYGKDWA